VIEGPDSSGDPTDGTAADEGDRGRAFSEESSERDVGGRDRAGASSPASSAHQDLGDQPDVPSASTQGGQPGAQQEPGQQPLPELDVPELPKTPVKDISNPAHVRGALAFRLFWLFAVTAVAGLALNAFLDSSAAANVNTWLERLLPAELGVFGSAIGFYYGASR
jgi:hypothetical protein